MMEANDTKTFGDWEDDLDSPAATAVVATPTTPTVATAPAAPTETPTAPPPGTLVSFQSPDGPITGAIRDGATASGDITIWKQPPHSGVVVGRWESLAGNGWRIVDGVQVVEAQPFPVNVDIRIVSFEQFPNPVNTTEFPHGGTLCFDLETAPDENRMESFGLDPLPEPPQVTPTESCPQIPVLLKATLDEIESRIELVVPSLEWLAEFGEAERKTAKPRAGVAKIIEKHIERREKLANAEEERRKLLSVTPEFCRIVAMGVSKGFDSPPTIGTMLAKTIGEERRLLELWWQFAANSQQFCGYNIIGFDLPVILARSVILGVEPSRQVDLNPFGNNRQVIDLMIARFGRGGKPMKLKQLVRCYGIVPPAGDTDGGDVQRLLANDPDALRRYVASDVEIVQQLRERWSGAFC